MKTRKLSDPTAVHPHACGEYLLLMALSTNSTGSPPRVWGIHSSSAHGVRSMRFTPTRVGNTRRLPRPIPRLNRFTPTRVGNTDR